MTPPPEFFRVVCEAHENGIYKTPQIKKTKTLLMGGVKLLLLEKAYILYLI
jgi:hypothetical protein